MDNKRLHTKLVNNNHITNQGTNQSLQRLTNNHMVNLRNIPKLKRIGQASQASQAGHKLLHLLHQGSPSTHLNSNIPRLLLLHHHQ
jgi:hypothetical protein